MKTNVIIIVSSVPCASVLDTLNCPYAEAEEHVTTWGGGGGGRNKMRNLGWWIGFGIPCSYCTHKDISTSSRKSHMKVTHEKL